MRVFIAIIIVSCMQFLPINFGDIVRRRIKKMLVDLLTILAIHI